MRAIIYADYGPPEVLVVSERPKPVPAADEVLIRVAAASINPIDARLRSGEMKFLLPGGFPRIPGYDVAGEVVAVGRDANFAVGDRVYAFLDHIYGGAYAEFAVCTHTSASVIPDGISYSEAAAIPLAGSTALQSLRDIGEMKSGDRVLINGASGGVGAFAVQIAKAYGVAVTAIASGPNREFAMSLGADDFIDYETTDFTTLGRKWDIVFDAAGKSSFSTAKSVLNDDGTFISTEPDLKGLAVTLATWPMSQQGKVMLAKSRQKDLIELMRLYDDAQLNVTVAKTFPLSDASAAHQMIQEESFRGKIVLIVE